MHTLLLGIAYTLAMVSSDDGGRLVHDYIAANDSGCKVWAPSSLATHDYIPRYTGACRDGRAEGQGKLEWLYRYAELKVKATWEGRFVNGVFLPEPDALKAVTPMGGDRYLLTLGALANGNLFLVARSAQDGPLNRCHVENAVLQVSDKFAQADDAAAKDALVALAQAFGKQCSAQLRGTRLELYNVPLTISSNGNLPDAFASARAGDDATSISGYSNRVAEKARQQTRQAQFEKERGEIFAKFEAFSQRNHIAAWVTTEQLDRNPFRYERKTVGMVVQIVRMLTADTALVADAMHGYGQVMLHGITPDFADTPDTMVVVAAQVGKREASPEQPASSAQYTALNHVESHKCAERSCADWLGWQRGSGKTLRWDEPYPPAAHD